MREIIQRLVWFTIVASVIAYGSFLVVGAMVNAQSASAGLPVLVRDDLEPGIHRLSGMVMVPSSCDELSVRTEAIAGTTYALVFRTWLDPTVPCSVSEVPRTFHAILFAPAAGVDFIATLDDTGLPIVVLPMTPKLPAPTGRTVHQ